MEYVDPHHKRTEFTAESFSSEPEAASRRIVIAGHGQHQSVVLTERGPKIAATIRETSREFVLWKAQILGKLKWLTLDFDDNPELRRIVVHIDHLNANELAAALKSLIGARSLFYHRPDV